jgi:hypothetical protein
MKTVLTILLIVSAGFSLASCGDSSPAGKKGAAVLHQQQGGLLYTFNLVTGTEALFDVSEDPRFLRNLLPERSSDADRLRLRLEERMKVTNLEELRDTTSPVYHSLRGLGYI